MQKIGIISDTHGLLRPEAIAALQGVDQILHAGDVGKPAILDALRAIAPVTAVRGNVDRGERAESLPTRATVEVAGQRLFMLHDIGELAIDPAAEGFAAVIFGHSHRPLVEWRHGVLFLNPGSAGRRRFKLPVTLARLGVQADGLSPELIALV